MGYPAEWYEARIGWLRSEIARLQEIAASQAQEIVELEALLDKYDDRWCVACGGSCSEVY